MRIFVAVCLVTYLGALPATAQSTLRTLDVFGSDQVDAKDIANNWGPDFEKLAELLRVRDWVKYQATKDSLTEIAGRSGVYAFVDLAVVESWLPEYGIHVTVDLVDPIDADQRLSYSQAPEGTPEDPEGLIKAWKSYDVRGQQIQDDSGLASKSCRAFFCKWGYSHPDLQAFGDSFRANVVHNEQQLRLVLEDDKSYQNRRAALYLLAHIRSQKALVVVLTDALNDQHHEVRTAALEMLESIASKRPDLINVSVIIPHLNGPATSERAMAISVLANLSGPTKNREVILKDGGAYLLAMIQIEQPANSDPAYELLKKLTGRSDLSKFDISSWTAIVEQAEAM